MSGFRFKRRRATVWASKNPILGNGEPGYDTTNKVLKIGDGVTAWNNLDPVSSGSSEVTAETIGAVSAANSPLEIEMRNGYVVNVVPDGEFVAFGRAGEDHARVLFMDDGTLKFGNGTTDPGIGNDADLFRDESASSTGHLSTDGPFLAYGGFIVPAPNGTNYRVLVDNAGDLSTEVVVP